MTWDEVVKRALYIYVHRDEYTYCLGASGEKVTDSIVKNNYEYYRSQNYPGITMPYSEWVKVNAGKRAMDCSGFLDYITGKNGHVWSSWSFGDMPKNKSLVDGVAGSALWKKGHVGIDIGYGYFLHFPNFNRTCEIGKISEYNWESSHLITGVDYTGADAR